MDGQGSFGPAQVVATSADGALSVFAGDVDGDGDLDALSGSLVTTVSTLTLTGGSQLTEKGFDLFPVMMALVRWGNRWHDDGRGRPLEQVHRACGNVVHAEATCSACGEVLDPRDMEVRAGPALRAEGDPDRYARRP